MLILHILNNKLSLHCHQISIQASAPLLQGMIVKCKGLQLSSEALQLLVQFAGVLEGLVAQKEREEDVVQALQAGEPGEKRKAKICQPEKQLG